MKINKFISALVCALISCSNFLGLSTSAMNSNNRNGKQNLQIHEMNLEYDDDELNQALYRREIEEGKSENYARYYANLVTYLRMEEKEARLMAKTFESEVKSGKTTVYADYYTYLIIAEGFNVDQARIMAGIFDQEMSAGKSYEYANNYAILIVICKLDAGEARVMAERTDKLGLSSCSIL